MDKTDFGGQKTVEVKVESSLVIVLTVGDSFFCSGSEADRIHDILKQS